MGPSIGLAPAYDIVCTTFFKRFSREMGMRLGSTRMIDDVAPSDLSVLAKELGIGVRHMKRMCSDLAAALPAALSEAGEQGASVSESLPYSADDIVEDMYPRLGVVTAFARD